MLENSAISINVHRIFLSFCERLIIIKELFFIIVNIYFFVFSIFILSTSIKLSGFMSLSSRYHYNHEWYFLLCRKNVLIVFICVSMILFGEFFCCIEKIINYGIFWGENLQVIGFFMVLLRFDHCWRANVSGISCSQKNQRLKNKYLSKSNDKRRINQEN